MNSKTKAVLLIAILSVGLTAGLTGVQVALAGKGTTTSGQDTIPLAESKLIIENNAKDKDTGFQGFIDSEDGWDKITVTDPNGKKVLEFKPEGSLANLGLTELFFETAEPENADVPINDLLKTMPEGQYTFEGTVVDEDGKRLGKTIGTATFSHDIPEAPAIVSPEEDDKVAEDKNLVINWDPVNKNLDGSDANIVAYQLIVEKDQEDPEPHMIGVFGLSMYLPPTTTQMTVPAEFLEPDTDYDMEILAIAENGNQSINTTSFSTGD